MPRHTIEQLKEQKTKLEKRIRMVAEASKKRERKDEARKKVLLGSLMMHWLENDSELRKRVNNALPSFLVRESDLNLFKDDDGDIVTH
jgi:hypothetical protein